MDHFCPKWVWCLTDYGVASEIDCYMNVVQIRKVQNIFRNQHNADCLSVNITLHPNQHANNSFCFTVSVRCLFSFPSYRNNFLAFVTSTHMVYFNLNGLNLNGNQLEQLFGTPFYDPCYREGTQWFFKIQNCKEFVLRIYWYSGWLKFRKLQSEEVPQDAVCGGSVFWVVSPLPWNPSLIMFAASMDISVDVVGITALLRGGSESWWLPGTRLTCGCRSLQLGEHLFLHGRWVLADWLFQVAEATGDVLLVFVGSLICGVDYCTNHNLNNKFICGEVGNRFILLGMPLEVDALLVVLSTSKGSFLSDDPKNPLMTLTQIGVIRFVELSDDCCLHLLHFDDPVEIFCGCPSLLKLVPWIVY
ncbi:hypothetical protein CAEBREN_03187 [Caenorhabditis brenneri]|uniref:Uncharacterized protein n=1 Tax=Caenorhabditis brenneri TaxID=135651 RepID=G0N1M1_CAEBE|nr:hypothetical protein CAEBREN_03187 [Caenorhabditis brenneri]